jgi:myo-inositol-1(or 4)-monophosphatase
MKSIAAQVAIYAVGGHNGHMSSWAPYLDFATILAAECSQYAITHFRRHPAERKADGSLVTAADRAVDRLIWERIRRAFPSHAILSEEQTTRYDADAEFTWIIDPIDGTTNFARGLPVWGVSIALLQHGQPVVGVVDFPLLQEQFTAIAGAGAWRGGAPIHTYTGDTISDEQLLMKCTRTDRLLQIDAKLKVRICGSAAYHLCKVADGTALAGIEATPKVWDFAAAWLITAEAGGVIVDWQQRPIFPLPAISQEYGSTSTPLFVAANPAIMQQLLASVTVRIP